MSEQPQLPLLLGFGLSGYRSFYTATSHVGPLTKVNLLAGQNNSGKSNVLRFAQDVLGPLAAVRQGQVPSLAPPVAEWIPTGTPSAEPFGIAVAISATPPLNEGERAKALKQWLDPLRAWVARETDDDGKTGWLMLRRASDPSNPVLAPEPELVARVGEAWHTWGPSNFRTALQALGGGTVSLESVTARLLLELLPQPLMPPVVTIGAVRRATPGAGDGTAAQGAADELAGANLIERLGHWENPGRADFVAGEQRFEAITDLMRRLLGDDSIRLRVPRSLDEIIVTSGSRVLPLSSLGSGVEQVLILAVAATSVNKTLVCIEEPETHLHPLLQKQLIRFLLRETDNQYLIATHSAHLIAEPDVTVLHVRHTAEAGSSLRAVTKPHQLSAICGDLGYRASDILQANSVIWVEGPSDRIYLKTWLWLVDRHLVEGLHFSIMFYGGRLLNHLSVDDEALRDFINLRWLNQHSALMIDSDRSHARAALAPTKVRLVDEFRATPDRPGIAWVTKCNTIENYVPPDVLAAAVAATHRGRVLPEADQWTNPLHVQPDERSFDKIAIAREVEARLQTEHLERYDLRKQLAALVEMIHGANDLSADM